MSGAFKACGVITLTTDTGHKGPFVATIKGVILRHFAAANIVELTHDAVVQWPAEAGFWLARSYRYFPAGSVHLCVVDPGARIEPHPLVMVRDAQAFLAPDNGVLAPLAAGAEVYAITPERLRRNGLEFRRGIFHGRDLFAPIAAALAGGRCTPEALGESTADITPSWVDEPEVSQTGVCGREVRGVVVTVDAFGNLITNIDADLVAGLLRPCVEVAGRTLPMRTTYADTAPGGYLALVNSFGVVEVARSGMSAEQGLGIGRGAPLVVRDAAPG